MMKHDHGLFRRAAGAALAVALAAGGLALAVPAVAEPQASTPPAVTPPTEVKEEKVIRRILVDEAKDGKVGVRRELSPEHRAEMAKCDGEIVEATADVDGSDGKRKTLIKLCGKPGSSKAEVAAMIEKALTRLEGDSEMPADSKAAIVAQLRAKVESLRAGQ